MKRKSARGQSFRFFTETLSMQLDGGREYANRRPPPQLVFGEKSISNY